MSVKELILKDSPIEFRITDDTNFDGAIRIRAYFGYDIPRAEAILDRNQSHSLYLYLKERFEPSNVNKLKLTMSEMWLCGCGLYHPKDFICERLK